jgi:integrase
LDGYQRGPGEYIFQQRGGGKLGRISGSFDRACVELNLMPGDMEERDRMDKRKKVWFHTLRHTFASWLAQSGAVTLIELRDLMRHSSIVMTERYAHLIPGKSQEKAAIIGDILNATIDKK